MGQWNPQIRVYVVKAVKQNSSSYIQARRAFRTHFQINQNRPVQLACTKKKGGSEHWKHFVNDDKKAWETKDIVYSWKFRTYKSCNKKNNSSLNSTARYYTWAFQQMDDQAKFNFLYHNVFSTK